MRLMFLQYGDYGEAARRFAAGGEETYYGQRYSVEFVAELARRVDDLTVLHLSRDDPEARLPGGIRTLGLELYPAGRRPRHIDLLRTVRRLRPDHLVLCMPLPTIIGWALLRGIRVLPLFADSFRTSGIKTRVKLALLARLLNSRRIDWVSNHNLAASAELIRIGVAPEKVLPFDWPALMSPTDRPAKELRVAQELKLVYIGQITESKGVGDLIEAVWLLTKPPTQGPRWRATLVGKHDGTLAERAKTSGLSERIDFVGPLSHDAVVPLMNQHDAVVVPSRHEYPEGLPMTIYEGLCSRTPIVASDHPIFKIKLRDEVNALVFPAGNPAALAACLRRLGSDSPLYARLSRAAEETAAGFFCPLKYHELITRWLTNGTEDRRLLSTFSLASGRYGSLAATG